MPDGTLDTLCINTLRLLAADAVADGATVTPVAPWARPLWPTPSGTAS